MATLNELGRNSASISYGPYATGQDIWPTFQAVDAWMRNDTWQGVATASGTTLTGVGTVWSTQARAVDQILVAGQYRTIASSGVTSDTSITVTSAFSPAITIASAVKVINSVQPTAAGTLTTTVRGNTTGVVSVTNGSNTIVGVSTYFLSDCTNSATLTANLAGTIAIDASGNITGTGTSFTTGAGSYPNAGTTNGLYPGDSIAVTIVAAGSTMVGQTYYFVVATVTNDTTATVTVPPTTAIPALSTVAKATNGVIGRFININGRKRQITAIGSNNSLTVNAAMDFTDSNLKLKVYPRGSLANATAATAGTVNGGTATASGTVITVTSPTGVIFPGSVIFHATLVPLGTLIVNQLTATSPANSITALSGVNGTNTLTASAGTLTGTVVVGMFVSGSSATVAGIPPNTYVTGITGTSGAAWTITLSNNITSTITSTQIYFATPGGAGTYTTSVVTTMSATVFTTSTVTLSAGNVLWDLGTTFTNSATSTVYMIQASSLDNIWLGDEVRTANFSSIYGTSTATGAATNLFLTDYAGYTGTAIGLLRQQVFGIFFKKEDTVVVATGSSFLSDLRIGDDISIDGTECTVTNIISNTQFKINIDFTHNTTGASVIYKKLKLHGYTLEGTREGAPITGAIYPGKFGNLTTISTTAGTSYGIGATSILVQAAPTVTGSFQLVKISGAGGPPLVLTGQINTVSASTTVTGVNTQFTIQLNIGAEIVIAGQHLIVTAIASDTSMTVHSACTITALTPFYKSVPLYTYILSGTTTLVLATTIKNTVYSTGANPPIVSFPGSGGDFVEFIYSAPNYYAESQSTTVLNQSFDRKYVGFRMFPLFQSTNSAPTSTSTIATAFGAYATPVYERWVGAYAQTGGVGVNLADLSGGVLVSGSQATTVLTLTAPITGSVAAGMVPQGANWGTYVSNNGGAISALATGTFGAAGSTYTVPTSATITGPAIIALALNGVYDITQMTQTTGGFIYLFATKRYFILQGKTFSNIQTQWTGCIEFERAQPEDTGTGLGASGVTFGTSIVETTGVAQLASGALSGGATYGFSQSIRYIPGIAPWPCYAYVNGNRFPTGSGQIPTLPVAQNYPIHGGVLATPRVRNSSGDLVGFNAHVYSACTITTGRWGHVIELGATGAYNSVGALASNGLGTQQGTVYSGSSPANTVPQIHMGQIIPVFTNVYNSKRFMFSPVVVLGPSYDPDIRGRMYGIKVIPSNLGALMDTVSITVNTTTPSINNPDFFYNTSGAATDHWVLTTPATAGTGPGQTIVQTYKFTTTVNASNGSQQQWRSLEDTGTQASNGNTTFPNNFRYAIPA